MKPEIELTFNKDLAIDHAEAKKKIEESGYTYFEWFNREGCQVRGKAMEFQKVYCNRRIINT